MGDAVGHGRSSRRDGAFMEPSGRNRWQPIANGGRLKWLNQADRQPMATHGNHFGAHGKEGVDGSSPPEGFAEMPANIHFLSPVRATRGTSRVHLWHARRF